ncbi:cyclase [Sulfolobales archaeon HS-7]|nr:cyclase [Sulfolobales archaeon HS-7]
MILDLSLYIENEMPFYPGDPKPYIKTYKTLEKDGVNLHELHLGTHTGTHVDVPFHFVKDGKTLDQIPLERFMGNATSLAVTDQSNIKLDSIPNEGDVLVLYTGTNLQWKKGWDMSSIARIDETTAKNIVSSGKKLVAIDSPSIGYPEVHRILLGNDIMIVENLNSHALSQLVGKKFQFMAFPILVKGVDGAPARALASINI